MRWLQGLGLFAAGYALSLAGSYLSTSKRRGGTALHVVGAACSLLGIGIIVAAARDWGSMGFVLALVAVVVAGLLAALLWFRVADGLSNLAWIRAFPSRRPVLEAMLARPIEDVDQEWQRSQAILVHDRWDDKALFVMERGPDFNKDSGTSIKGYLLARDVPPNTGDELLYFGRIGFVSRLDDGWWYVSTEGPAANRGDAGVASDA